MNAISFESGLGTPFIRDGASSDVNDATSTKQNIDGQTGLVVMGSNDTTGYYWHNSASLGAAPLGADFSASPTAGSAPLAVQFADTSSGSPTSWAWDFDNDGTVDSTAQNPSHTYTTAGTFSVKLIVTDAGGATSSKTRTDYVVAQPLIADFTAAPTVGSAPLSVAFTDTSTGSATGWAWDFENDGVIDSTERNPSHSYTTPGTYTVRLAVADAAGNADTKTRTDYVLVSKASGQVTFRPSEDSYVRSLSPTANYGTAPSLRVKYGGATGETYTTYMKFSVAGLNDPVTSATLRLYVTDPAANGGQLFRVAPDSWAEGTLNWNNAPATAGTALADLGAVVLDSWVDVPVPRNEFTGGNGTYSFALKSPVTSGGTAWYSSREGTQQPQLVLTTASDGGPVIADFTGSPTHGDAPLPVAFTDLSSGSPTQWLWNFGDGTTSTAQSPSHTYTAPGSYNVTLTVTEAGGATSTKTRTQFVVVENLAADFSAAPTSGYAPLPVAFADRSTGLATGWRWEFGDGSTSTDRNPSHTYGTAGSYTVKLTVTDAAGNTSTTTKAAYVTALQPVAGQVTVSPVADSYVHSLNPTTNYGSKGTLRVRDGGATSDSYRSYLKFDVAGLTGPVDSARLRVFVTDPASDGGDLYSIADTTWTESGLTWNNAPPFSGIPARPLGPATNGTWVEFPLDPRVFAAGDGTYSFTIVGHSSEVLWYGSRETANPPQLIVTSGS
jgi:PKD repeat protein